MAARKTKDNTSNKERKEKNKFNVEDFIIAEDWVYTKPGKKFFDNDFLEIIDFLFFIHLVDKVVFLRLHLKIGD